MYHHKIPTMVWLFAATPHSVSFFVRSIVLSTLSPGIDPRLS